MPARNRLVLVLALVPLCAFTCVPTPLMRVSVVDEHRELNRSSLSTAAYDQASELAASLAARFQLDVEETCAFGRYRPIAPDRCLSFRRFGEEGIYIEVAYEAKREVTTISLVKEARVFGKYTTAEVRDAFRSQLVLPILAKFGEERVHVRE